MRRFKGRQGQGERQRRGTAEAEGGDDHLDRPEGKAVDLAGADRKKAAFINGIIITVGSNFA